MSSRRAVSCRWELVGVVPLERSQLDLHTAGRLFVVALKVLHFAELAIGFLVFFLVVVVDIRGVLGHVF